MISMSRNRRTRILVNGDPALSQRICDEVEVRYRVRLLQGPHEVLVMNKVRESAKNSLFYLGEALLTECKVLIEAGGGLSASGIGLILGEKRERAYELAVIDAAFSLPEALPEHKAWLDLLVQEEGRLALLDELNRTELDATRVEFASMLTEDDVREGAK